MISRQPSQTVISWSWVMKKYRSVDNVSMPIPYISMSAGIMMVPIKPENPIIAKALNIFDPKRVPTAISIFPFLITIILVIISGKDVPKARMLPEMA